MKVGGRAYKNGVRLFGENYSVKAYYEDNKLKYEIGKNTLANNKIFLFFKKIPVLRGIMSILFSLINFFKEMTKQPTKYWPILLLIFINIALEVYFQLTPPGSSNLFIQAANLNISVYITAFMLIFLLLRATLLKEIFQFHGAEHKAVNYYEANFQGDFNAQSRLARRCGTNLIVFYLFIIFVLESLGLTFNLYLESLLALGIAYEIILASPKLFLTIPYLIQKLTTIEPDPKHLKASKLALKILLDAEKRKQETAIT